MKFTLPPIPQNKRNYRERQNQPTDRIIKQNQQQTTQKRQNFQNLKNFDFPLPSIDEQKEIIAHIEILKQHFKKSVDNYQTQIDRLKEYKNILINQAVTGKIKI
jgi:type I restriction enzyme S subunit